MCLESSLGCGASLRHCADQYGGPSVEARFGISTNKGNFAEPSRTCGSHDAGARRTFRASFGVESA